MLQTKFGLPENGQFGALDSALRPDPLVLVFLSNTKRLENYFRLCLARLIL